MCLKTLINLRLNEPLNALLNQFLFAIFGLIVAHTTCHTLPRLIHVGHILSYKLLLAWQIAEESFKIVLEYAVEEILQEAVNLAI